MISKNASSSNNSQAPSFPFSFEQSFLLLIHSPRLRHLFQMQHQLWNVLQHNFLKWWTELPGALLVEKIGQRWCSSCVTSSCIKGAKKCTAAVFTEVACPRSPVECSPRLIAKLHSSIKPCSTHHQKWHKRGVLSSWIYCSLPIFSSKAPCNFW